MPTWLTITIAIVVAVAVTAATMIKILGKKKQGGEKIGWLDVLMAWAEGVDDAKDAVGPEAKKKMMAAIRGATEKAGVANTADAFLKKFGFNQSKPDR